MSDLILSDDPTQALREIASYLQTVRKDPSRRHYEKTGPEGLGKEFAGYWQTPEWVEGLIFLYHEAIRVAALQSSRTTTQMEGVPAEGETIDITCPECGEVYKGPYGHTGNNILDSPSLGGLASAAVTGPHGFVLTGLCLLLALASFLMLFGPALYFGFRNRNNALGQFAELREGVCGSAFGLGHKWLGASILVRFVVSPISLVREACFSISTQRVAESYEMGAFENVLVSKFPVNVNKPFPGFDESEFDIRELVVKRYRAEARSFWRHKSATYGLPRSFSFIKVHNRPIWFKSNDRYHRNSVTKGSASILERDFDGVRLIDLRSAIKGHDSDPCSLVKMSRVFRVGYGILCCVSCIDGGVARSFHFGQLASIGPPLENENNQREEAGDRRNDELKESFPPSRWAKRSPNFSQNVEYLFSGIAFAALGLLTVSLGVLSATERKPAAAAALLIAGSTALVWCVVLFDHGLLH
jgi:hypothetical protein